MKKNETTQKPIIFSKLWRILCVIFFLSLSLFSSSALSHMLCHGWWRCRRLCRPIQSLSSIVFFLIFFVHFVRRRTQNKCGRWVSRLPSPTTPTFDDVARSNLIYAFLCRRLRRTREYAPNEEKTQRKTRKYFEMDFVLSSWSTYCFCS